MLYLFDIDGTLIGGDGYGRRAFEAACEEILGIPRSLEGLLLDGMTDPLILAHVYRTQLGRELDHAENGIDARDRARVFERYLAHLAREVAASPAYHVKPGVVASLDALGKRPVHVGLATGNLEHGARIKLERAGLWSRFAFGGYGSDAAKRSELVRAGISRGEAKAGRKISSEEIWVIGDTPLDVAAAHEAGASAIAVATGRFTVEELRATGAEHTFSTLTEFVQTVA